MIAVFFFFSYCVSILVINFLHLFTNLFCLFVTTIRIETLKVKRTWAKSNVQNKKLFKNKGFSFSNSSLFFLPVGFPFICFYLCFLVVLFCIIFFLIHRF